MRGQGKIFRLTAAFLLSIVGYAAVRPHQANGLDITGTYTCSQRSASTLEIKAEGSDYVVSLSGGSSPAAGAAAPADCYVRARGKLHGKTLTAEFVSIETDTFSYSAAQAEHEKRQLTIVFNPGSAEVVRADTFGYCGVDSNFVGHYQR